ncbi:MAG TPA: hypothetical protein VGM78_08535 [Ilumatobacteraceae bacterium]
MNHSTSGRRLGRTFAIYALALAAVCAACGSAAAKSADVASLGSAAPAATSNSEGTDTSGPTTTVDPKDAFVAYTKCMRDNGVDMPDPQVVQAASPAGGETTNTFKGTPGGPGSGSATAIAIGNGSGGVLTASGDVDPNSDDYKAASAKCQPILDSAIGTIKIDPKVEAEQRQQMLDFAKCMRDHGIDMPDPVFGDSGTMSVTIGSDDSAGGVDPSSDAFQTASKACAANGDAGITFAGPAAVGS